MIQPTYLIDQDFPSSVHIVFQINFLALSRIVPNIFYFFMEEGL